MLQRRSSEAAIDTENMREKTGWEGEKQEACGSHLMFVEALTEKFQLISYMVLSNILNTKNI